MSTTAQQPDLGVYNQNHDFLRSVVNFMSEREKIFRGSATELAKVLYLDMNPRVLSLNLEKINGELENRGIFVTRSKMRGKHIIKLSNTPNITHRETSLRHPTKHTPQDTDFATPPEKEPITFPFEWQYGTIGELRKSEKNEVNRIRHIGRKEYKKPCSVCGEEGVLEYRKISDANSALLCETCAKSYVVSAVKLLNEGVGGDAIE